MANTYVAIATTTVGAGGAANITFSNIPQTFTDLVIKGSVRSLRASDEDGLAFGINGNGATSWLLLNGDGSTASSGTNVSLGYGSSFVGRMPGANATASTFGNWELYLPNYSVTGVKSFSSDAVTENNGTAAYASFLAGFQSNTSAVTSVVVLAANANLAQYSTATLYGIKNS